MKAPGEGGGTDEKLQNKLHHARTEAARYRNEHEDTHKTNKDFEMKVEVLNHMVEQYKTMANKANKNKDRYKKECDDLRVENERIRREQDEARWEHDQLVTLHEEERSRGRQHKRSHSPPPPRGDYTQMQR